MYITLTNTSPAHKGQKIAINSDLIATVYDTTVTRENDEIENITLIFCPPHGTWEVAETLDEIVRELNNASWNKV
jgi:hypothetical protein